ncbi:diguanylate cyclase domain-containing protein [Undibacterium sp. Ji67W]|uniref:sensor domain-containing protein n=1 Tax=Undibacterium sp. Ji67W TaxID=3413042 RepID=UPI003BF09772
MHVNAVQNLLLNNIHMPFDEVMRHSPLGMAVINFDGTYEAVNEVYCNIYGYTKAQMLGQSFTMVFKPEARSSVLELHQRFLKTGGILGGEWEVQRADGNILHVISESAQVPGTDGTMRRLVYVTDITARKAVERDLEASHLFVHSVLDALPAQICVLDENGIILSANSSWVDFLISNGGDPEILLKQTSYLDLCKQGAKGNNKHSIEAELFYEKLLEVLAGENHYFEIEYPSHLSDERRWFIARVTRIPSAEPSRIIVSHDNVTALKVAQEELHESLTFTRKLINSMQDGFTVLERNGRALEVNPALCRMTGFLDTELLRWGAGFPYWPQEDNDQLHALLQRVLQGAEGEIEVTLVRKNGTRFPANMTFSCVNDENGYPINYIATIKDITERKRMEDDVHRLAFYDPLTNLPNRRLLHDRIEQSIAAGKRSGNHAALLMIDLDNFKPLNDNFGHDVGDLLLIEVASRLRACVREIDTVARFGGDEFVIIISELQAESGNSKNQVTVIAEKIRNALCTPYMLPIQYDGKPEYIEHRCSASIGVALFNSHNTTETQVMKWADKAMYQAKDDGRNLIRFYVAPSLQ